MSLREDDPRLAALRARSSDYGWTLVGRAGERALAIHADEVSVEHLLGALMADEDSAAHAAVIHAFADPETLEQEVLAVSPGLLVVASDSTLPFSTRAVRALRAARARVVAEGSDEVTTDRLLAASLAEVDEQVRADLLEAGLKVASTGEATKPPFEEGSLFRTFTMSAKRALSQANRIAAGQRGPSISPAHLLLGGLQSDAELAERSGVGFVAARAVVAGRMRDDTPPPPRSLSPDEGLLEFLGRLPADANSLEMLAGFQNDETSELNELLLRHKITPSLLERARGAFRDPASP